MTLFILMKEKYKFENAKNQKKVRKYALMILRVTKSTNFAVSDQIAMIWNDMNVEFQRNINRFNDSTMLDEFLNNLNKFKDIWWQLTRRKMSFFIFKNSNYRTDQYQQFYEYFSEHSKEYRKNYFCISNFYLNNNNR